MRLLVTGGSGFIGSAVVRQAIGRGMSVVNVDKMTYAATEGSTSEVSQSSAYTLVVADIVDKAALADVFERHRPDRVMHLAAESHVDRSIDHPSDFVMTNVVGTTNLLSASTAYYESLSGQQRETFRFHHVSTDEVFGSLGPEGRFTSDSPYDPRSPYSASKAAADHLVRAWYHTYDVPVVLSNCSNNYGPFQFPEKLIPLMIIRALRGMSLPVYGSGQNVRDWLFVEDHAGALLQIAQRGEIGATYLIGGEAERRNIDVVTQLCAILDEVVPRANGARYEEQIEFVTDRPGHDQRYAIDVSETVRRLGWSPTTQFEEGLAATVRWYIDNEWWWQPLTETGRNVERFGLAGRSGGRE